MVLSDVIGVIGAGTMGIGVATDLIAHGYNVKLVDMSEDILIKVKDKIKNHLRILPLMNNKFKGIDVKNCIDRLIITTDLNDLNECMFIIENIVENVKEKESIFKKIDKICNENTYFCSNTSGILITQLANATTRPDKVIGVHFMNPVYMKSTVEVIKGCYTSEECISFVQNFLKTLDKEHILVNDSFGFISNRVSHLFMNEAAFVVYEKIGEPKQVDDIFKKCYGHIMGPLETADLIGIDTVVDTLDMLFDSYKDSKFRCCPLLRKMVASNQLGRKAGKGFYKY